MEDHPQTEISPLSRRQERVQFELDLDRIVFDGQTQSLRQPADVGVDRQARQTERDAAHHIAGLAADAGQRDEVVESGRHLAAISIEQAVGHSQQVARLVLVEAGRANQIFDLCRIGLRQFDRRRVSTE